MTCSVPEVLAPDGTPSKLFSDLKRLTGDASRAMEIYLNLQNIVTPAPHKVDSSGEIDVEDAARIHSHLFKESEQFSVADVPYRLNKEGKKDNPELDARMKHIDSQIRYLRKNLTSLASTELIRMTNRRIGDLVSQKKDLLDAPNVASMRQAATQQLNWARSLVNRPVVSDQEIAHAMRVADSWSYAVVSRSLHEKRRGIESAMGLFFEEIGGKAEDVSKALVRLQVNRVRERIQERIGRPVTEQELMIITDIGTWKQKGFDASKINNLLIQYTDVKMKDASRDYAGVLSDIVGRIDDAAEGINTDRVMQKGADGKPTGRLISAYSASYNDAKRTASNFLKKKYDAARGMGSKEYKRTLQKGFRAYYDSLNKIEIGVDVRFLIDDKHSSNIAKNKAEYMKYLEAQIGPEKAAQAVQSAADHYDNYLDALKAFKQEIQAELIDEVAEKRTDRKTGELETNEEYMQRNLSEFSKNNNPIIYFADRYDGNTIQSTKLDGSAFAVSFPRTIDAAGQSTGFYDEAFANLSPAEENFVATVTQVMEEMKRLLPAHITQSLPSNFLGVVQKDLMERFTDNGVVDFIGAFQKDLKSGVLTSDFSELVSGSKFGEETDPDTGQPISSVPIKYVADFDPAPLLKRITTLQERAAKETTTDEERLRIEKDIARMEEQIRSRQSMEGRSLDPVRTTKMFAAMALNYGFKIHVEDEVNLAIRLLEDSSTARTSGGKPLTDEDGNPQTVGEAPRKALESLIYARDALLYGQKTLQDEGVSERAVFGENKEGTRRLRSIRKEYKAAQDSLAAGDLTQKEFDAAQEELAEEYRTLSGRNLVLGKVFQKAISYTQIKSMGWNAPAAAANVGFGMISNYTHAATGLDFNLKEINAAGRIMLGRTFNKNSKEKVAYLMKKFSVLFEVAEIQYGMDEGTRGRKKNVLVKTLEHLTPLEMQKRTEFFIQGHSFVAQMMHQKVKVILPDATTTEISLFDAYDERGRWDTKRFGPEPAEWASNLMPGEGDNKYTKFRNKVIQVNKMLHGNYDTNSPMMLKKTTAGRAVAMFRTWMAEGWEWRFGSKYYDMQLDREQKGRYRSFADITRDYGWAILPSVMMQAIVRREVIEVGGIKIDPMDAGNMRANMMELQMYVGIFIAATLLAAGLKGDDDDETAVDFGGRIVLSQLTRLQSDLSFYVNPASFTSMTENAVPALKSLSDFSRAAHATKMYLTEDDYRGFNPAYHWLKTIPGGNAAVSGYRLVTSDPTE